MVSTYLTQERLYDKKKETREKGGDQVLLDINEAILAYENKDLITLQTKITSCIRWRDYTSRNAGWNSFADGGTGFKTTLGRFMFNEILPQDLGFVDRSNLETNCFLKLTSL